MTEAQWLTTTDPDRLLDAIRAKSPRKCGLFVCACCRRLWSKLPDPRSRRVVDVAEKFLDGGVSLDELLNAVARARAVPNDHIKMKLGGHRVMEYSPGVVAWCCEEIANNGPHLNRCHTHIATNSDDFPAEWNFQSSALRCICRNPFRFVDVESSWLTSTVLALAAGIYEERAFDRLPILADALQDAGCDNEDILKHCQQPGEHVRGCWVVDLLLGKK
jgi:hypothetical protein